MGDFSILANRIKQLRSSLNKTQREFASIVGCTAATLSAYENGSKSPSLEIVKNIAEKTNTSIDWLCGLSNRKNSNCEFKTYSDVIEVLNALEQTDIHLEVVEHKDSIYGKQYDYIPAIIFDNIDILTFLNDWMNMIGVRENMTIKEDLYKLWIKDQLEQNNKDISNNPLDSYKSDKE